MKNVLLLLMTTTLLYGCNTPATTEQPPEAHYTPGHTSQVLNQSEVEAAQKAYSGNLGEVDLAVMALQKTHDKEIRSLATMIQEDHQKAEKMLEDMSDTLDMDFQQDATAEQERLKKELAEMEGAAFDRRFVEAQIAEHEKDLEFYRQQAQSTNNTSLANYFSETVPVLEKHLTKAREVKSGLGETQ